MTFTAGRAAQLPPLPSISRRARVLIAVVAAIVVLLVLFGVFDSKYTNLLWFRSVGYSAVWRREVGVQVTMFFIFAIAMAAVVLTNIVIALRGDGRARRFATVDPDDVRLDDLPPPQRTAGAPPIAEVFGRIGRRTRIVLAVIVALIVGVPAGSAGANRWQLWLLFHNRTPFGVKDAQFHRDVSYYAFVYPLERFVLNEAFAIVTVSIVAVLIVSYLLGGFRSFNGRLVWTPRTRAHVSVLLGVFVLLKAAAYWLDRYALAFSTQGNITGPSYTDVHATLPAKTILVFIAIICALLFFANLRTRNWRVPALAFGLMAVSAIVIGGIYPALVQSLKVKPSQQTLEQPYIQRNINATRTAYGISTSSVTTTDYAGTPSASTSSKAVRADAAMVAQVRLLDPNVVTQTFDQLQQERSFYSFNSPLAVDRYVLPGSSTPQDVVIGTRNMDLSGLPTSQRNWINEHLIYTHGYGVVAAATDQIGAQGNPDFIEQDLPPTGDLGLTQPRVYFGTGEPSYSIVGAPAGSKPIELDRPSDNTNGQQNTTYTGSGGVPVGSLFDRILYAWKLKDKNVLLSSQINSDSRILYIRDPQARVAKVAPWLTLDSDPYPVVAGGDVDWVVDGYTTSNAYPYSEQESLASATTDTTTNGVSTTAQGTDTVNYIRNSVKAVVNAYTGAVTLYEWNPGNGPVDPVLQTWMKAFPGVVKPMSQIPASLMPHLRYPEDLFNIQRSLISKYHVTDAKTFYNGTDFWTVPDDPTVAQPVSATAPVGSSTGGGATGSAATTAIQIPQPSYYQTVSQNGSSPPVFALTTPFTSLSRRNLTAYLSVNSDPTSADYGKFDLLQLPADQAIDGPGQVQNDIESDTSIGPKLTLLRQSGSRVVLGNLLTIPVDGVLIYIEPIYVQASGGQSFPVLRKVVADYQGQLGYADTLSQALDQAVGATVSGTTSPPSGPPSTHGNGKGQHTGGHSSGTSSSAKVKADLARIAADSSQAQADLRAGRYAAFGKDEKKLAADIEAAQRDAG